MAGHVLATIYGTVQSYDRFNGGYQMTGWNSGPAYLSFPSVGTIFIGVSPAETLQTAAGTFTINAIIQVVPSGLNQPAAQYATDSTVGTLNTGAA
jgi:hypothetical protein